MPNNKEPVRPIFNSDSTNVERFVGLYMKMDDLNLSNFREMRLKSKGDFNIA